MKLVKRKEQNLKIYLFVDEGSIRLAFYMQSFSVLSLFQNECSLIGAERIICQVGGIEQFELLMDRWIVCYNHRVGTMHTFKSSTRLL
jgi:hypothetical protein